MRNPWHVLATGFGSGLSPVVPGTMGSLASIPFWYLMTFLPWQLYSLVVMMSICIGVYICHRTAKDMGTHDHGSIVWDEFVGMWITLMALHDVDDLGADPLIAAGLDDVGDVGEQQALLAGHRVVVAVDDGGELR